MSDQLISKAGTITSGEDRFYGVENKKTVIMRILNMHSLIHSLRAYSKKNDYLILLRTLFVFQMKE